MMLQKNYWSITVEDGSEDPRELSWAELFPSVFDRDAPHKPFFKPLGNEQGNCRLEIHWAPGNWAGPNPALITVTTSDPDEEDIDVIEDHRTFIFISAGGREQFTAAYALARQLAAGTKLPADYDPAYVHYIEYRGAQNIVIDPSRHHVAEAA